jgi:hypothetical protein
VVARGFGGGGKQLEDGAGHGRAVPPPIVLARRPGFVT